MNARPIAAAGGLMLALLGGCCVLAGCASPGKPLPPSLKLPEIVPASSETATRVGDQVRLHWTTPQHTTDKLLIAGPVTAEICREVLSAAGGRTNAACSAVARVQVTPGASDAVDTLPAELTAEPARLLSYRVQLLNAAGRTAGPSPAVFAASGPAPRPVEDLLGRPTKAGAVLEWSPEALGTGNRAQGTESPAAVELERVVVEAPASNANATAAANAAAAGVRAGAGSARKRGAPGGFAALGSSREAESSRFRAGDADRGGTIDRSVETGHTYRYTAQRVRSVAVGGQTLEVRSAPSAEVTVAMLDEFPPDAPAGLVAVPGFAGEGEQARRPAIDLSWEPNAEPRIAGYRVYRQIRNADNATADAWRQIDAELVAVAAYRDASVEAGKSYAYRVTAVDAAGHESARSEEVVETAPQ